MQEFTRFVKPALAIVATAASIIAFGIAVGLVFSGCGGSSSAGASSSTSSTTPVQSSSSTVPTTSISSSTTTTSAQTPAAWAQSILQSHGYTAVNPNQFAPSGELRVLVGRKGNREQAFFFVGDHRWLGTDTKQPSASISIVHQDGRVVVLSYALFAPGDAEGSPSAGTATVSFSWNGSKLTALDPIPSADPVVNPSRR